MPDLFTMGYWYALRWIPSGRELGPAMFVYAQDRDNLIYSVHSGEIQWTENDEHDR